MAFSARVLGMDRLRRRLGELSEGEQAAAKVEVKRGALAVQSGARRRSPVDTGRLRNSITHELAADELSARIGTNVEYAPHVEFGTRRARAQPYLFPALESEVPRFVSRMRRALQAAARKAAR